VVGLQLMAIMHRFDMLSRAINNLPPAMMEEYCEAIVQCMIAADEHTQLQDLRMSAQGVLKWYGDDEEEEEDEGASVHDIRQAFKIIQCLDRLNAFEGKIRNQGWMKGERNYRHKLQERLQNLDDEDIAVLKRQMSHVSDHHRMNGTYANNGLNGVNNTLLQTVDSTHKDDMEWFNALANFAFNEE